jgi:nitrogen-specific signal transduction histidine kinase
MGGDLTADSSPGRTVFRLSLPLSERPFPRENEAVEPERAPSPA